MLAVIITFWHPLRLAEDVALLDLMTEAGSISDWGAGCVLGRRSIYSLTPIRQRKIRPGSCLGETLAIMKKAWTESYFSCRGPNFTFPVPGIKWDRPLDEPDPKGIKDGELAKLFLVPKPYQKPYPPLWMMVATEPSFKVAAELGVKGVVWIQTPHQLRERLEVYAQTRSAVEGRSFEVGEDVAWLRKHLRGSDDGGGAAWTPSKAW